MQMKEMSQYMFIAEKAIWNVNIGLTVKNLKS